MQSPRAQSPRQRPVSARMPGSSANSFYQTGAQSPRGSPRLDPYKPNPHLYHSGQIDPALWWKLHTMKVHAKTSFREPMMSMQSTNSMYLSERPVRPFAQPSLPMPSPRSSRPQSARGMLTHSYLQQAKNFPAFKKLVAQALREPEQAVQTEVTGEMIQQEEEAKVEQAKGPRAVG